MHALSKWGQWIQKKKIHDGDICKCAQSNNMPADPQPPQNIRVELRD